jgi:16S rRNA (cytidine1402-2'-O)-methyltransferase
MTSEKIILLPLPISAESNDMFVTPYYCELVKNTTAWVAENARTTRRFIASLQLGVEINDLKIFEISRNFNAVDLNSFLSEEILKGDIMVTSEAGLPGMADPGAVVVKWAHRNGIRVLPVVGPGSVYMSLCASGFNGQQFVFHGYCPIQETELTSFLKKIHKHLNETGYTQIFIETPDRTEKLFQSLVKHLPHETQLCIALGIHSENESILTKSVAEWIKVGFPSGKVPCVFLIGH